MLKRFLSPIFIIVLSCAAVFAQSMPTATLTGKVTTDGGVLPGVTVTVQSPNLQGTRTVITSEAGDYLIPFLPPGDYTVTFDLAGMQTVARRLTLAATRTDRLDIELRPAALAESITVTAETPVTAILESTQVSTTFRQAEFIEKLPTLRNLEAVTLLAPGVTPNGPGGNLMISGAMSYDSLYLINGAIVNENLRGQPHDLFIEDAIQETTVLTGGISAEYGHFTGGVVNAITKSGGNDFRGSFRTNLTSESWIEPTRFTVEQSDEINDVYEATLGGPFLRDRLWFFGAGRLQESQDIRQTSPGNPRTGDQDVTRITYPHAVEETRLEGKLTGALTPRHNLVASYVDIDDVETNQHFSTVMDLASLNPKRETPNTLLALNYTGALSNRFFIEAQYSEKEFAFIGSGARCFDLICGTLMLDRARRTRYNSPTFKFKPDGEQRNHELSTIKGTYFWSTPNYGSHDIKVGYQDFLEVRAVNNFQSGSDFRISIPNTIIRGSQIFPRMPGGSSGTLTRIIWTPIFVESKGSDYATQSVFVNDRWSFNEHWTFNVGLRHDKNDAISGDHTFRISGADGLSPRLAANYDFRGDGRLVANLSYNEYVGRLAEGVGNDGDPAGRSASFQWNYRGPSINSNVNAPTNQLIPTQQAIQMIFDWFFANGGTDLRPLRSVSIPGIDTLIDPGGLVAPNVKEWTLGIGTAIGTRGYARADLIFRGWDDFYAALTNRQTGQVSDEFGNTYDLTFITNSNTYEREYTAVQTQFSWRPWTTLNLGGTYTWARLVGNVTGENSGSGPLSGSADTYPEYREARWNYPMGYLTGDQRHRLKAWASYDLETAVGLFNFTMLQNFDSGGRTSLDVSIDPSLYVPDLGYIDPPESVDYFIGGRGNVKHQDITRTDIALNYSARLLGGRIELFLQPEVINVFNEQGVLSFNEEILTAEDDDSLQPFNPFTETPIEGVHWRKGQNFGRPSNEGSFQQPRTFRFSVGLKF